MHPARRDPGVEAHLLHGRARDEAAVGARHEIHPLGDDDPPCHRFSRRAAQRQDLALHRAHRRQRAFGQPVDRARPRARCEHGRVREVLGAVLGHDAADGVAVADGAGDRSAGDDLGALAARMRVRSADTTATGSTPASCGA